MGCLCCRDREKPENESLPLNSDSLSAINQIERTTNHRFTVEKQTSLHGDRLSPGRLWTPQLQKSTNRKLRVITELGSLGGLVKRKSMLETGHFNRLNASLGVRLRDSRVVLGGLERYYRLSEGKVGQLVQAEHTETSQKCWIHMSEQQLDKSYKERKQRLTTLRSLDHPNILKLLDFLREGSHLYTVYEATEGGTAADLCNPSREVDERWVATIMQQVFAALNHCYSKGLIPQLSLQHILFTAPPTENCISVKLLVSLEDDQRMPGAEVKGTDQANCVWRCGVVLSTLLAGENIPLEPDILSQSTYMKWQSRSKDAKTMALALLCRDHQERPTLAECLQYPWLAQTKPTFTLSLRTALRRIAKLRPPSSLKKAFLQLMLSLIVSPEELREVRQAFLELDTDMDGTVTEEELRTQLLRLFPEEQAHTALTAITSTAVFSAERELGYSEFLLWACSRQILSAVYLDTTFHLLDTDKDGVVTHRDLREFFTLKSDDISDSYAWQVLLSSVSTSMDRGFHFEEFRNYMLKP